MAFWAVRLASTSTRSLGLVATQTLTFLFTDMRIDGGEESRAVAGLAGLEVRRAARIAAVAHGG